MPSDDNIISNVIALQMLRGYDYNLILTVD